MSAVLDHWCEVEGRDPASIRRGINLSFHLGLDERDAKRESQRMEQDWGPMVARVRDGALMGTPDTAMTTIQAYLDAGATDVNIALRAPWNQAALDAYINECLPALRRAQTVRGSAEGRP